MKVYLVTLTIDNGGQGLFYSRFYLGIPAETALNWGQV